MADLLKRKTPTEHDEDSSQLMKRHRPTDLVVVSESKQSTALTEFKSNASNNPKVPQRTSSLLAPTMLLEGHQGHVYSCKFSPDGQTLVSGSFDKDIFLWEVYGECKNYMVLKGHQNAVLEVQYSKDGEKIFSASCDKTAAVWDAVEGVRLKRARDHSSFVNTCFPSYRDSQLFITGSDDGTAKLYDIRVKACQATLDCEFPVLAACFTQDNQSVLTAGIEESIRMWDLRKNSVVMTLEGHSDSITGVSLSPDGSFLLSNSMDNTLRCWDIRPYAPHQRCVKVYMSHQHGLEKNLLRCSWSADGSKVAAGSADRMVYIWDAASRRLLYKLPGHAGSVNEIAFHPKEPIVASGSSDSKIYMGEIFN
eukprot:TRINITY_DN4171_c0_g1_i3.p1 TRINITY_DN4171_c0_g1~~TRINITY_DN4171_c0_g1_i3.p1  ORF type:complete len:388 (-),score=72.85 TRINITY_DN4171_c0_g1_i3:38-1132(-)